ncbi:patatin-like phospholipase family protein [Roseateles cellulosilyticus]|uniref:Patatin-like phospholipase family protein n=1 Tax=Pelomonas cellulosilytica TaxID=2906762 RepID=A0ABS8XRM3_9BURK|nr:patatin-like phospholipase family protein [Pelomonas sp. P8]MCE4553803.1 patatin-like phospholipase family protein [Pelomonas sp. P8]
MTATKKSIALALSGGGIRAMAFHLGVLKHLAERGVLESVEKISTVSGGSLVIGLLLQQNGMRWPSSEIFLTHSLPGMRGALCSRSLQWGAVRQLLNPKNWRFLLSRANLLALALQREWQVTAALGDLPDVPEWSINGTTAESGKRFRFKFRDIGEYTLGYASATRFPLASALAVSAAFPGGFGPLAMDTGGFEWRKREWDAPVKSAEPLAPPFRKLHLYDGGVYDNLGIEPFFDAGRQRPKHEGHYVICADAGAPLTQGFDMGPLNAFRLKRVADIMSDQARSLRVRTFVHYLQERPFAGAYLAINTPVTAGVKCESAKFASSFPTTLRRLTCEEFDQIALHGAAVAARIRLGDLA